jgi:hypothetical protein
MTDLWIRNADRALAVCAQEGVSRLTWTRQHLHRLKVDGLKYVRQFYMHTAVRPKIMLIGIQGSSEYDMLGDLEHPLAVYPSWSSKGDTWQDLMRMIDNPAGSTAKSFKNMLLPTSLRPVEGQKHRIVIHNSMKVSYDAGKRLWYQLAELQSDHPEVELFINGVNAYSVIFGLKFQSVDFGLSDIGDINRRVILPNGLLIKFDNDRLPLLAEHLVQHDDWIKLLGFTSSEILRDQNKRFAFRIRSARWAAKHWANNLRFHRGHLNVTPDEAAVPDDEFIPRETNRIVLRPKQFSLVEADKILCNRCRIQVGCRFYRADAICGLRESEMSELDKFFGSRNAGTVLNGLSELAKLQARRLDSSLEAETQKGEIDPQVSKDIKALFDSGVKLAKLLDPTLAGPGVKVQINNVNGAGGGSTQIVDLSTANPKQVMAGIVLALEQQGIPREAMTPEMIQGVLKSMAKNTQQNAIEAAGVTFQSVMGQPLSKAKNGPVILDAETFAEKEPDVEVERDLLPVKRAGRE